MSFNQISGRLLINTLNALSSLNPIKHPVPRNRWNSAQIITVNVGFALGCSLHGDGLKKTSIH